MADELHLLPGDNPQAYIPGDRRRALARGQELPRLTHGAAVFVDISGFTPLTEALARELGGRRGAEELSATLDRIFAALMEPLHAWNGSVVYFSGDAVTAWIDGDDGTRAIECGLAMQQVMARVGVVQTPSGVPITLGVKVAVAVGEVHRFVVGDPRVQLIDVLAGALMDSLAAAEQQSAVGRGGAGRRCDRLPGRPRPAARGPRGRARRRRRGRRAHRAAVPARHPGAVAAAAARRSRGSGCCRRSGSGWPPAAASSSSDLRPAFPIFVRFGGLDFENDPDAPQVLDDFVTRAELALDEQGGYVLQLTIGDKGAYLYAVFGSPIAHEDDAARACEAALRLLEIAERGAGHRRPGGRRHRPPPQRHLRPPGAPYVLLPRRRGQPRGAADDAGAGRRRLGARRRRGRGRPIASSGRTCRPSRSRGASSRSPVRRLLARVTRRRTGADHSSGSLNVMVGRDAELARLRDLWSTAEAGQGQVVVVQAEAGTGKSRLVGGLVAELVEDGVPFASGEASPLATQASYAAWRGVWADLLGLDEDSTPGRGVPGRRPAGPRAGRPRAAARPGARRHPARQRPHRDLRRRAPQDLAGGPAGAAARGPRRRGGRRRARRRGRPLARPALARPAGVPLARPSRERPCCCW